jgi:hypothetical protein
VALLVSPLRAKGAWHTGHIIPPRVIRGEY